MEFGKNLNTAVASAALLLAGGSTVYTYRRIKEMDTEVDKVKDALTNVARKLAEFGGTQSANEKKIELIINDAKKLRVTAANQSQELQDLQAERENDNFSMMEWSNAVLKELRALKPDAAVPELIVGEPPRRRTRRETQIVARSERRPRPYKQPATRRPDSEEDEDRRNLDEFNAQQRM